MQTFVKLLCALAILSISQFSYSLDYDVRFKRSDAKIKNAKDHTLFSRFPGSIIYDYSKTDAKLNEIILSSVHEEYDEIEGEHFYEVTNHKKVSGENVQIVYDLPEEISPTAALNFYKSQLEKYQSKTVFECQLSTCGDTKGWQIFVYPEIGSSQSKIYYQVSEFRQYTVALLVSDIAQQTRVVLDISESKVDDFLSAKPILEMYFEPGRFQISEKNASKLREIENVVKTTKNTIYVSGYADFTGTKNTNLELSKKRAFEVKEAISEFFSIPKDRIVIRAYGEKYAIKSSKNGKAINKDRRVEIRLKV